MQLRRNIGMHKIKEHKPHNSPFYLKTVPVLIGNKHGVIPSEISDC